MISDRLTPLVEQARAGNSEALGELVRLCGRDLRTYIATFAASNVMIAEVEREAWQSCRRDLASFPDGTQVLPWLCVRACTPLRRHLDDCERQAVADQDSPTHILARSGLEALAALDGAHQLGSEDVQEQLKKIAPSARSLLDLRYAQGLSLAQVAATRSLSVADTAHALATVRSQVDWVAQSSSGLAGDDRQFATHVEELFDGTCTGESRVLLTAVLLKDLARSAQFERQARLHLLLTAMLGAEPADHSRSLAHQVWGGDAEANRLMFGSASGTARKHHDAARTHPVAASADPRRTSAASQRMHHAGPPRRRPHVIAIAVIMGVVILGILLLAGHGRGQVRLQPVAAPSGPEAAAASAGMATDRIGSGRPEHAGDGEAALHDGEGRAGHDASSSGQGTDNPGIFLRGIHFGAGPVTIDRHRWLTLRQAQGAGLAIVAASVGDAHADIAGAKLDFDTKAMLATGITSPGPLRITQAVPNGSLALTLWLAGTHGVHLSDLALTIGSQMVAVGAAAAQSETWCRIGPYPVTVTDHHLVFALEGLRQMHLAGMAIAAIGTVAGSCQPVVSLSSPVEGSMHHQGEALQLQVDLIGDEVCQVDYYNADVKIGGSAQAPFSLPWTAPAAGSYTLSARATDGAGTVTQTAPVTVTVVADSAPAAVPPAPVPTPAPASAPIPLAGLTADLIVWDGDAVTGGAGFNGFNAHGWGVQHVVAHAGSALRVEVSGGDFAFFGYNWFSWAFEDAGTDVTAFDRFCIWMKLDGPARPTSLTLTLRSSPKSAQRKGAEIDIVPLLPDIADGAWHQVILPMALLAPPGCALDLKKVWEVDFALRSKTGMLDCTVYLDDIGFARPGTAAASPPAAPPPAPPALVQAHFVKAIDLGGTAVAIDGNHWLAEKQAEEESVGPAPAGTPVYLSDIPWTSASCGYGMIKKDLSIGGNQPMSIHGKAYPKGIGTHAKSEIIYALDGTTVQFQSDVGIDDETHGGGHVLFQVYLDGVKAYDSGPVTGTMPALAVQVGLIGTKELKLTVEGVGDNINAHADWAGARLLHAGGTFGPLIVHNAKRAMVAMAPKPAVDAPTRAMLTSSLIGSKDGLGLSLMLPLGQYQILVYVMETGLTNSRAFDLELNGELAAVGLGALASGAWARYGPYPVTITSGTLELVAKARKGVPQLMGLEIWSAGTMPSPFR